MVPGPLVAETRAGVNDVRDFVFPGSGGSLQRRATRILGLLVLVTAIVGVGLVHGPPASAAGASWSPPYQVDSFGTPTAISCTSSSFCAGVDDAGDAGAWTGGSAASGNQFDAGNALTSVSCASSSMCVAVDNSGNFIRYNGSTWSAPAPAESFTGSLGSVSSASTTFCVAVDNFLGGASSITAQRGPTSPCRAGPGQCHRYRARRRRSAWPSTPSATRSATTAPRGPSTPTWIRV